MAENARRFEAICRWICLVDQAKLGLVEFVAVVVRVPSSA